MAVAFFNEDYVFLTIKQDKGSDAVIQILDLSMYSSDYHLMHLITSERTNY